MTPQRFEIEYLPQVWNEAHLQAYIHRRLKRFGFPVSEVRVKTPTTTRRIDIATWWAHYEVKDVLTYDNIYHAVGQLQLYGHYAPKLLGFIPKKRIIIGLAPSNPKTYREAARLAEDFRGAGISVVFINESSEWYSFPFYLLKWAGYAIASLTALILALTLAANW